MQFENGTSWSKEDMLTRNVLYIFFFIYLCVCVCVWLGGGG